MIFIFLLFLIQNIKPSSHVVLKKEGDIFRCEEKIIHVKELSQLLMNYEYKKAEDLQIKVRELLQSNDYYVVAVPRFLVQLYAVIIFIENPDSLEINPFQYAIREIICNRIVGKDEKKPKTIADALRLPEKLTKNNQEKQISILDVVKKPILDYENLNTVLYQEHEETTALWYLLQRFWKIFHSLSPALVGTSDMIHLDENPPKMTEWINYIVSEYLKSIYNLSENEEKIFKFFFKEKYNSANQEAPFDRIFSEMPELHVDFKDETKKPGILERLTKMIVKEFDNEKKGLMTLWRGAMPFEGPFNKEKVVYAPKEGRFDSYNTSLLAGFVYDTSACALYYFPYIGGFCLSLPEDTVKYYFRIHNLSPLITIFLKGEFFHERLKSVMNNEQIEKDSIEIIGGNYGAYSFEETIKKNLTFGLNDYEKSMDEKVRIAKNCYEQSNMIANNMDIFSASNYFLLFYDRSVKNEREAEILKNNQMNLSNYYHINYLEEKKKYGLILTKDEEEFIINYNEQKLFQAQIKRAREVKLNAEEAESIVAQEEATLVHNTLTLKRISTKKMPATSHVKKNNKDNDKNLVYLNKKGKKSFLKNISRKKIVYTLFSAAAFAGLYYYGKHKSVF